MEVQHLVYSEESSQKNNKWLTVLNLYWESILSYSFAYYYYMT